MNIPPEAENFGDFTLETMILLRKIVLEQCKKPKFSGLRRAQIVKGLKTLIRSAAGEKNLGSKMFI